MRIRYEIFEAGHCCHPERTALSGGTYSAVAFPALCFLLYHPDKGAILFDTGFSSRFSGMCRKWPGRLYNLLLPVEIGEKEDLAVQLRDKAGINPADVRTIIVSHFHNDHIAGLMDFPAARILCGKAAYDAARSLGPFSGVLHGLSPALLPQDMASRVSFIEDTKPVDTSHALSAFAQGYDLFGDASIVAIPLPGHAPGHYGLFFTDTDGRQVFLVADACWSSATYRELRMPHPVTRLVHQDWKAYTGTIHKLHQISQDNKNTLIIPSHCREFSRHA